MYTNFEILDSRLQTLFCIFMSDREECRSKKEMLINIAESNEFF